MASTKDSSAAFPWAKAATLASVAVAVVLSAVKAAAWQRTGSAAILGSFADSLLDLVSSVVAFIGVRMAAVPADFNHRYGHHKAEAVSSLVQLVLITGSAVFVLVESIRQFLDPKPIEALGIAVWVMIVSIGMTAGLVSFQTIAIRRSKSVAAEADRAHYIGDFISNAGALFAVIVAATFGLIWVDALAGLTAAGFLLWSVWEIARRALPQLMDEELTGEERQHIHDVMVAVPGVIGVHALRTRRAGDITYIQAHMDLDAHLTLKAAHVITTKVENAVLAEYPTADIIIHQDPHGHSEDHDPLDMVISGDPPPAS